MDYGLVIIFSGILFLLINAAPIAGAVLLAKKIADNLFLRWSLAGFFFLLESTLIFSLTGLLGVLDLQGAIIGSAAIGVIFILLAKAIKRAPEKLCRESENTPFAERIPEVALLLLAMFVSMKSAYLPGTDTMLYHLYNPATWIEHGRIFAIPMQGLPHEYFPICGETLYGWLLFGGVEAPLVCLLQPAVLLMALLAVAGLWKNFNIPVIYIKLGALLTVAHGVIIENSSMCYTDVLTGSLLVCGICWLLRGIYCEEKPTLTSYAFTASGALAMGLCAAIKYSGLVLAPLITLFLLIFLLAFDLKKRQFSQRWQLYLIAIICAVVSAGVFYLPNWLKTGNPFYPVKIPFLFSNGVDFERSPLKLNEVWSFFVNRNTWSMNEFSALLFIALIFAALLAAWKIRQTKRKLSILTAALLFSVLLAGMIMLLIYPAATQVRQAIPFLMALSVLLTPALYSLLPQLDDSGKKPAFISAGFLLFTALTAHTNYHIKYILIAITALLVTLLISAIYKRKVYFIAKVFLACATVFMLYLCWYIRWVAIGELLKEQTSKATAAGVLHLRNEYKQTGKALKIASCGSWFNYYMLLDMPGNRVECVPVNAENTLSAHKVSEVRKLRNPADYFVWFDRLKQGNFTHLVIQLDSHQDYGFERDLELKWALKHPENFTLIVNDKNVYFFSIKY